MKLFVEIDTDNDGIVNSEQFELLYKRVNLGMGSDGNFVNENNISLPQKMKLEMISLLDTLDPQQTNKILLSDIIRLFMNHKV